MSSQEQRVSSQEPTVDDVKTTLIVYKALNAVAHVCSHFKQQASGDGFAPKNPQQSLGVLNNQQRVLTIAYVPAVIKAELSKRLAELKAEVLVCSRP